MMEQNLDMDLEQYHQKIIKKKVESTKSHYFFVSSKPKHD